MIFCVYEVALRDLNCVYAGIVPQYDDLLEYGIDRPALFDWRRREIEGFLVKDPYGANLDADYFINRLRKETIK